MLYKNCRKIDSTKESESSTWLRAFLYTKGLFTVQMSFKVLLRFQREEIVTSAKLEKKRLKIFVTYQTTEQLNCLLIF